MDSLKRDIARLTTILKQKLKENSIEASITQPIVATYLVIMTPFHQQNSNPSGTSLKAQFISHYLHVQTYLSYNTTLYGRLD
jgi:hypothetical protein